MNKPSVGSWMWYTVHSQCPPCPHRLRPAAEPVSPMGQFWSVTHLGQLFLADIASFPPTVHFLTSDKMDIGPAGPEATSDQTFIAWKCIPACRHSSKVTQECSWSGHLCTLLGCSLEAVASGWMRQESYWWDIGTRLLQKGVPSSVRLVMCFGLNPLEFCGGAASGVRVLMRSLLAYMVLFVG